MTDCVTEPAVLASPGCPGSGRNTRRSIHQGDCGRSRSLRRPGRLLYNGTAVTAALADAQRDLVAVPVRMRLVLRMLDLSRVTVVQGRHEVVTVQADALWIRNIERRIAVKTVPLGSRASDDPRWTSPGRRSRSGRPTAPWPCGTSIAELCRAVGRPLTPEEITKVSPGALTDLPCS